MVVYILMLIISLVFSFFIKEKNNKCLNNFLIILSAFPFFFVTAFRYDVGTDYMFRYTRDFVKILAHQGVNDLEIGFKFLYNFCIFFTSNSQSIFIATSFIIITLIFKSIHDQSKNITLSILLFFVGAFFFQSLNLTREYISIALILFSYSYLLNGKYFKWIVVMIISILFHSSSIIYAMLSFVTYIFIKKCEHNEIVLNYKFIITLFISMFLFGPIIKESIMSYMSFTRFKVYIGSQFDYGDLQIIPFILNILLFLWMVYCARKSKKLNEEGKYYLYIQFFCIFIIGMGKYIYLVNRLSYYFTIFQIISVPYFLSILKEKIDYKKYILNVILIIVAFSSVLTWTHILHSTDEVLPYKTIINL